MLRFPRLIRRQQGRAAAIQPPVALVDQITEAVVADALAVEDVRHDIARQPAGKTLELPGSDGSLVGARWFTVRRGDGAAIRFRVARQTHIGREFEGRTEWTPLAAHLDRQHNFYSRFPEEAPFADSGGGMAIVRLVVHHPERWRDFLPRWFMVSPEDRFRAEVRRVVVHELAHVMDPQLVFMAARTLRAPQSLRDYRNDPREIQALRAEVAEFLSTVQLLPAAPSSQLVELLLSSVPTFAAWEPSLTPANRRVLLADVGTWIAANRDMPVWGGRANLRAPLVAWTASPLPYSSRFGAPVQRVQLVDHALAAERTGVYFVGGIEKSSRGRKRTFKPADPGVIAFLDFEVAPEGEVYIHFMETAALLRHRGFGRRLVDELYVRFAGARWIDWGRVVHDGAMVMLKQQQADAGLPRSYGKEW